MKQTKEGNGIGVVVAAYNAAAWLGRCLDSVLAAADECAGADADMADGRATDTVDVCAADVWVVVADDGSTDGTAAVARRYAASDSRVRLLELAHGCQAAARKAAIAALPPQAVWVMIVDADDTLPRHSLSQLAACLSGDVDMVAANVAKYAGNVAEYAGDVEEPGLYMDAVAVAAAGVKPGDGTPSGVKPDEGGSSGAVLRLSPSEALERMLDNAIPNFTHGMVVRRELFGRIDWDTHPSITNAEDAMLQLLLASAATRDVCVAPQIVAYEYRQRPGTLSAMGGVTPEGIGRVWDAVSAVPAMPRAALARWGLGLMHLYFIGRGVWLPQGYPPLRQIVELARGVRLHSRRHRRVLWLLRCPLLRALATWRHR